MSHGSLRGRSGVTKGLCAFLATLLFWLPVHTTLVKAQENEAESAPAPGYSVQEGLRNAAAEEESLKSLPEVSPSRSGLDGLDREQVDRAASDLEARDESSKEQSEIGEEAPAADPPPESVVPFSLPTGPSKTAVTPQQIALPKGEGSIEGMGESFTPNLSSGTGTFSVPIALPKGRAGVQPSLALSYSTSGGNGIVGFGWSLAVPFISRQTDKGLPRYVDSARWTAEEDTFMYNGGQELVPVDSAAATLIDEAPVPSEFADWQQYRARVEGAFMRFFRAPDASRWVVQSKDGTRFEFGLPGADSAFVNDARQRDPETPSRIFSWQLVRMSDVHGSTVHYTFTENGGILYPQAIYYLSPASCARASDPSATRACAAPLSDYGRRVGFVYQGREDVTSSYVTGYRTEQALRLKRIEITSAGDGLGARTLVRRYRLAYQADTYHSLLASVQVEGRPSSRDAGLLVNVGNAGISESSLGDVIVGELLPPMRFSYSAPAATTDEIPGFGGIDTTLRQSAVSPPHSVDEGRADLFDVNSDGLPDLLVTDPARYQNGAGVFFNGVSPAGVTKPGTFSEGVRIDVPSELSSTLNLSSLNILPMDVDGDGRSDILHMPRAANYGYFLLSKVPTSAGSAYAPTSGWEFHHVTDLLPRGETDPRIDLGKDSPTIKTLDVNNDHLIDIVRTTGLGIQTWLNLGRYPGGEGRFGTATFSGSQWNLTTEPTTSCLPFAGTNLDFSDSRVRIADMNGDGLQDIVKVSGEEVLWWPGRGPGAWGDGSRECDETNRAAREIRMENPPRELNSELAGLQLLDVNNDGATDLVYVGFSEISIWFNKGGEAFTDRLVADGTPYAIDVLDRVRVADVDGSGTTDILFADSGRYRWIDPMGGMRPRLLKSVDNGLGALTTLEYSSSIEDYLRDLDSARACDPAALDCFTWQREPSLPGARIGDCDARVLAKSGTCAHRAGGSPVVSTVVRRVRTTDRLDVLGVPAQETETEYLYHDGYYEGIEQEFRGFGAADAVVKGDVYEPTSTTRTYFHQGRRPNEISATRLADNPNEALKGREYLTEVWDELGIYLKSSHATYAVRKLLTGRNGVDVSYAYVKASDEFRYNTSLTVPTPASAVSLASVVREASQAGLLGTASTPSQSGDADHVVAVRHNEYALIRTTIDTVDNVGNLRKQTAWGRNGRGEFGEPVADERVVTRTEPVRIDDASCGGSRWLWRTGQTWVEDASGGTRFGETQSAYSGCGDLLYSARIATLPSNGPFVFGGAGQASGFTQANDQEVSSSTVDAWGQATAACGGANITAGEAGCLRLSKVSYDTAYAQLAVQETTSVGTSATVPTLTTTATWDRGLGIIKTATDPNSQVSEVVVDGLGRVTGMLVPPVAGCQGLRVPTTRIEYQLTSSPTTSPLSRIKTTTILDCATPEQADSQLISYAYVDGLGRPRASLAEGEPTASAWTDGFGHAYTKSGIALFTKKGQPYTTFQPAFFEGSPDDLNAVLALPNAPAKRMMFDGFGRPTVARNEDGTTFTSISYHALSRDLCDEADNGWQCPGEPSFAGTCTTERTDGHGRTIDQQLRQVTAGGAKEQHRLFSYYRADGAVMRVVRALTPENVLRPESGYTNLTRWVERRFHYDTLGRRVASEDPDTDDRSQALTQRTWRYLFNRVGDLVAVRDPRGCGQNFYYDLAGRLVGEAYVGCAEAQVGEQATASLPTGMVSLTRTTAPTYVHVRNYFDEYPSAEYPGWTTSFTTPAGIGVRGRATASADRGQLSAVGYDDRGNVVWGGRQLAVTPGAVTLTGTTLPAPDGRPAFDAAGEGAVPAASVVYDSTSGHTYVRTAKFDHAGRSVEASFPKDPDYQGTAPVLLGKLFYHRNGAARRAELSIDGASKPVIANIAYTYDGLPGMTTYGDAKAGRDATVSNTLFDLRRRPTNIITTRVPTGSTPQTLSAVSVVQHQALTWDGASNLCMVDDRRDPAAWPEGHKPYSQEIFHDALYRVTSVRYKYKTASWVDTATDWRTEEDRHRAADPMQANAADMVSAQAPRRIQSIQYGHDWLANTTYSFDDARVFYERSVGSIANGQDLTPNRTQPNAPSNTLRPSALYLATNLMSAAATPSQVDRGGWLETDYGKGGNLLALTVHGQCSHTNPSTSSCVSPVSDIASRRAKLRADCTCAREQHYVYRWDELNRLHEARRYDRNNGGAWTLAARQRVRYDGANQRVVKQVFDPATGQHRAALYVYPGDFERRGLVPDAAGNAWIPGPNNRTETQYLVAGARVVWQNGTHAATALDAQQRITFSMKNLIQSTSAVIDLISGELVEVGGFYPNGAREESLGASDAVGGAGVPLEPVGFTGKEADEEVGLTYFGERYLVQRIGRWASPDPLSVHAMAGGEAGNAFHYVSGNLLQGRDPLGLDCVDAASPHAASAMRVCSGLESYEAKEWYSGQRMDQGLVALGDESGIARGQTRAINERAQENKSRGLVGGVTESGTPVRLTQSEVIQREEILRKQTVERLAKTVGLGVGVLTGGLGGSAGASAAKYLILGASGAWGSNISQLNENGGDWTLLDPIATLRGAVTEMVGEFAGDLAGDALKAAGKGVWLQFAGNTIAGTAAEFALSPPGSVGEATTNIAANTASALLDTLTTRLTNPVTLVMGGVASAHPSVGRTGQLPRLLTTTLELAPAFAEGALNLAAPRAASEIDGDAADN